MGTVALVDVSRELTSDMIRLVRHANEGIWGLRRIGGKEKLIMTLMNGKARDEKIGEPVERNSQDLNLVCAGSNW